MPRDVDSTEKTGKIRKIISAEVGEDDPTPKLEKEIVNGQAATVRRQRPILDARSLSMIKGLIEKNVSKKMRSNKFFSALTVNGQSATSPIHDSDEKSRRVVWKDDSPRSTADQEIGQLAPIIDEIPVRKADRVVNQRVVDGDGADDDDDNDLRNEIERRASRKKDLRSRITRKIEDISPRVLRKGSGLSTSKRYLGSHEPSSSGSESSSVKTPTPPKRKSEVVKVQRQARRESSSESELERSDGDLKKRRTLSREDERRILRVHRKRWNVSAWRFMPSSRSPESENEERFTFFFTKKYPFSNHYPCEFTIDGRTFNCTEQYYMYKKAVHFGDHASAEFILAATDPKEMKNLGKSSNIRGFREDEWNRENVGRRYMREANLAKYQQNADLREHLLNTRGTTLVEANPTDSRWGIGLSMDNPLRKNRRTWRGQNWLGEILTKIREQLIESSSNGDS